MDLNKLTAFVRSYLSPLLIFTLLLFYIASGFSTKGFGYAVILMLASLLFTGCGVALYTLFKGDDKKGEAKKDDDKAFESFESAIQLLPAYADAYYDRGLIWAARKETAKAIADFGEAIRLGLRDSQCHRNRGFAFYTNLGSRKAMDIRENRHAALLFDWPHVGKRVYVHGKGELVRAAEADAYFATRPKLSRIGAWASRQSQPLRHRWRLWLRIGCMVAKWATRRMSRPSFWSGFRLVPREIYFERVKETIGHPAAHPSPHHEGSAG